MRNTISTSNNTGDVASVYSSIKRFFPQAKFLSKGWRSFVFLVDNKVLKVHKRRETFEKEVKFLKKLSGLPFVPKVYKVYPSINGILMEYVKGKNLKELFKENGKKEIRLVVKLSLLVALTLDFLKLYNPEMNRPVKHLIFEDVNSIPKLIDYERFIENRVGNFTQLASFFFLNGGWYTRKVAWAYGDYSKEDIIKYLREVKKKLRDDL